MRYVAWIGFATITLALACGGSDSGSVGGGSAGADGDGTSGTGAGGDGAGGDGAGGDGAGGDGTGGDGTGGDGAGGTAGGGPTGMAGAGMGTAGTAGGAGVAPGTVELRDQCANFTACGGLTPGAYRMSNVCFTQDELGGPVRDACPAAKVRDVTGSVRGGVVVGTDSFVQQYRVEATATVTVPNQCLNAIVTCDSLAAALAGAFSGSSCSADAMGCTCTVPVDRTVDASGTYTVEGEGIELGNGDTYDVCDTNGLQYRETTTDTAAPGLYALEGL